MIYASSPILACAATPRSRSSSILSTIVVSGGPGSQPPPPTRTRRGWQGPVGDNDSKKCLDFSSDSSDEDLPFRLPPNYKRTPSKASRLLTPQAGSLGRPQHLPPRPNPSISLLPANTPPLHGYHRIIDRYRMPTAIPREYFSNSGAKEEDRTSKKTVYYVINCKTGRRRMVPYCQVCDYVTPRELERWEGTLEKLKKQSENLEAAWTLQWEEEDAVARERERGKVSKMQTRSMRKSQAGL
ncbi:hypothetical protein QBC44DRAFT_334046 [Cladorrhinum sp. PSN332]|nr:hypothetical protein QBC44DRAFT_334046 [Cladorrhinum sp. PSN332]